MSSQFFTNSLLLLLRSCVALRDAFFAERAETIAYNALGGIGTKDLWTRVYLQQPNEVFAGHSNPHVWNTDGDDSTTYSLQDN